MIWAEQYLMHKSNKFQFEYMQIYAQLSMYKICKVKAAKENFALNFMKVEQQSKFPLVEIVSKLKE